MLPFATNNTNMRDIELLYFVNLLKYCHNLVYLPCYDKLREIHIGVF